MMTVRLKNDILLNKPPFREDDETTTMWKEFVLNHCSNWLNNFWSPVKQNVKRKTIHANSKQNEMVSFVKEWVFFRLFDSHQTFPPLVKEVLQDLFKICNDSSSQIDNRLQFSVFTNIVFLRFLLSFLFQMSSPQTQAELKMLGLISKLVIRIVSLAMDTRQHHFDDTEIHTKTLIITLRHPLQIFMKKVSQFVLYGPFDVRKHAPQLDSSLVSASLSKNKPKLNEIAHFSVNELMEFFFDQGLHEVIDIFGRLEIHGKLFSKMTEIDLKQIGITRSAFRKRIIKIITTINQTSRDEHPDFARRFSF